MRSLGKGNQLAQHEQPLTESSEIFLAIFKNSYYLFLYHAS